MAAIFKPFSTKNGIDINSFKLTNLADPVETTDAVNKRYSGNASNITSGTLDILYGGTNANNAIQARTNLLPYQSLIDSGKVLTTNGTDVSWQATFSGNYNDLSNIPTFATVATTGDYADLLNKPSYATVATTGKYSDLIDKPTYSQIAYSGLLGDMVNVDLTGLQDGQFLSYDATLEIWKAIFPPTPVVAMSDLTDVDETTKTEGSVLAYDTTTEKWTSTNVLSNITIDGGSYSGV
jgi:hypothetical protein